MKKLHITITLAVVALFYAVAFTPVVFAQQLQVATGGAGNTYSSMFKQLAAKCGNDVALLETNTSGSQDNINRLVGNQVNAAFVQSDVLYLRARTEELGNVKTLLALHPEQVHIVARAVSGIKEGGVLGVGGKDVVLTDITHLAGRRVGAAGGSQVTAQVIRLQSEIPFVVQPFDKDADAIKALGEGQVDAVILVGGAPLGSVAAMGPQFKLLGVSPPTIEKLKGVYRPARLNYSKLGAAGVPTVSTDALFVTREYKTARMTDGLAKLRMCALASLDDLKETTGTHPAWQGVDGANKGKWAWYELRNGK